MKLGNLELRQNGAQDFTLVHESGVVLRTATSIARCTETWLAYEAASEALIEARVKPVHPTI